MKTTWTSLLLLSSISAFAQGVKDYKTDTRIINSAEVKEILKKASDDSVSLSKNQDELSADVQELIEDQTNEKVITLLENAEELMAEVTNNLEDSITGIETIGTETEIIEKIFEAAKEKSK